ncbi:MAG: GntR family transcriptional regulator [Streptosporangiaceae bacterium]
MDVPGINRRSAIPPHRQIAAWLRARIEAGEFDPAGEIPLPSEKDLVDVFGVARDTARRAVQVPREEGWVVTVPQRGTYAVPVSERPRPA